MDESILTNAAGDRLLSCPDGTRLSVPSDPACCDTSCPRWLQFRPCGSFDCAGGPKGPGSGPMVWVCASAVCSNVLDQGVPVPVAGRPLLVIVVGGVCYTPTGLSVLTLPEIPPGELVVEDLVFTCGTNGCASPGCGDTEGWARAIPCDPAWPDLYFCRSTVPWCVTMVPPPALVAACGASYANRCYTFNPTRPVVTPPPGACRVVFPPGYNFNGLPRSCCDCGTTTGDCNQTGPLLSLDAAGPCSPPTFPGGCCGDTTNAVARHNGRSVYEFDYVPSPGGAGFLAARVIIEWHSSSATGGQWSRVEWRRPNLLPDEPLVITDSQVQPIAPYAPVCPVPLLPPGGFPDAVSGTRCPGVCGLPVGRPIPPAIETRTVNRWTWNYSQNCNGEFGSFGYNRFSTTATADLINMNMGRCGNNNCAGSFSPQPRPPSDVPGTPIGPQPAQGTDGGSITIRGGGSRQVDPAVAAILEQQSRGGGCAGCGGGWAG